MRPFALDPFSNRPPAPRPVTLRSSERDASQASPAGLPASAPSAVASAMLAPASAAERLPTPFGKTPLASAGETARIAHRETTATRIDCMGAPSLEATTGGIADSREKTSILRGGGGADGHRRAREGFRTGNTSR